MTTRIAISGGLDPVHIGHIRMIDSAHKYGQVIVILNSDEWLIRKKGYFFMPQEQRAEILRSVKNVTEVYCNTPEDDIDETVCKPLKELKWIHQGKEEKLNWFGNGGDRRQENTPEMKTCEKIGIKLAWNLGGSKVESSSELILRAMQKFPPKEIERLLRKRS